MTDTNQAAEYADSLADTLAEIWQAVETGEEYEGQDALEYLGEMPLEIVWEIGERFAILLTFGGPNAWIHGGGREGGYTLDVYWGGEQATNRSAAISMTGDYFREGMES